MHPRPADEVVLFFLLAACLLRTTLDSMSLHLSASIDVDLNMNLETAC